MADKNLTTFGKHLRDLRLRQAMTQEALADRSGLHPTYIGGIERGERNLGLANILRLANALGVRPSALLSVFDDERGDE
jgi:transcriptional regulator with XRE-family HTH domain